MKKTFTASGLLLLPGLALAHTGVGEAGSLLHGLSHPWLGADHLCAMVAVGLWAAQQGGRALWLLPLTFVGTMALGGVLGMTTVALPYFETGILLSLLVLGSLIAAAVRLPQVFSLAMIGFFALFHGYAHGAEMPVSVGGLVYALGFMLSTALLHGIGVSGALGLSGIGRAHWLRLAGAGIALFGGALFFAG